MIERSKTTRRPAVRPACEALEGRALLAMLALPTAPTAQISIVPSNGDGNPYGVAFEPAGIATGASSTRAMSWSRTSTTPPDFRGPARRSSR